ncbi:MAG: hypothetical protein IJJ29_06000 [Solobacterium sp.]|nr:hypothetical protein [Solobacterium sp.]
MKKYLPYLICMFLISGMILTGCQRTPAPPASPPQHTSTPKPRPTPTPEPVLPLSFTVDEKLSREEIMDRLRTAKVGYPSRITEGDHVYTAEWIMESSGKTVGSCTVNADPYPAKTRAVCTKGDGYHDYVNGDTELAWYPSMPQPGSVFGPTRYIRYAKHTDRKVFGGYTDADCAGDNGRSCTIDWYADTADGPVLLYRIVTENEIIVSSELIEPERWRQYRNDPVGIKTVPYDAFPHDGHDISAYEKKESSSDRGDLCEEDYLDMYEGNEDEFDDEEEAYDYWIDYCQ